MNTIGGGNSTFKQTKSFMAKQLQKRYQFFGKNGVEWTSWFNYTEDTTNTIQLQGRTALKNEYRTIETK